MASAPYKRTPSEVFDRVLADRVLVAEASLEQKNGSTNYSPREITVLDKVKGIEQSMEIIMSA